MSAESGAGVTLARGAFVNTLAFLGSNLRGIFTFLVARLLGGAALGTFGVAWAVIDLASKFGTLGLDYSVMTFVARCEASGDRRGSQRIRRTALTIATFASVTVATAGCLMALAVGRWWQLRPDVTNAIAWLSLAMPGIVIYRVSNGLSRGMQVMHHDVYSRGLTESLGTAVALLIALALGARELAPVIAAIAGTTASGLVAFTLARSLYTTHGTPGGAAPQTQTGTKGAGAGADSRDGVDALLRASLPIALYDLLNIAVMRIDVIMLGWFAGRAPGVTLETVGIYAACVEIAGGLRKVSQAVTPIFTPVLAEQLAAGQPRAAEESYGHVGRWVLAVVLPAVVVLTVSGGALLRLFGPGFDRGTVWLTIAGVACGLNAFVGLGEVILMIQRPAWNVMNTSIACATAIAINAVLIPRLGVLGAAIGMLVPYVVQGLLRTYQLTRLLAWRLPWRALARPWLVTLAALPVAVASRLLLPGVSGELAAAPLFVVAYLGGWWIGGLEPDDRAVLARFRR